MDDYTREMMDLRTLVTRTLEKKGVLAKIRAELRASVFEAIEEEDHVIVDEEPVPPALLGSCNDRAKKLHVSDSGRLLTALICEYLDWAELGHTLKVYLPECNLQKDFWRSELQDFYGKYGYDSNRDAECGPLLLEILESFLKSELRMKAATTRRAASSEMEYLLNNENKNSRRPTSSSTGGVLPPLGRTGFVTQGSDRRVPQSVSSYKKDDHNWRYSNDSYADDVIRASNALENVHLDRKGRNMASSWRCVCSLVLVYINIVKLCTSATFIRNT